MLFSVVIPAYNAEKFILRSIDSVLKQKCQDFELIVVNDGSKDDTLKILEDVNSTKIKIINQENQGVSVARNNGIMAAQGDFICFLDADDEYIDIHLETMKNVIAVFPQCSFFATKEKIKLLNGKYTCPSETGSVRYYKNPILPILKKEIGVWTGVNVIRRSEFYKYGMFEPGYSFCEDIDMWERVYVHTGLVYCDKITAIRNRDGSELTKFHPRQSKIDPFDRMSSYLSDLTISDDVKDSLKTAYEWSKLSVVRTYILKGKKFIAYKEMMNIDRTRIPFVRYWITFLCLFFPSNFLRKILQWRERNFTKDIRL